MFKYTLLMLFIVGAIGCSNTLKPTKVPQNMASRNVNPVLIIADPQIHNIYGLRLKQMMGLADLGSKVAIRPAELNILAPLLLDESIKRNKKAIQAIIVLGDSTNIACENESNIFYSTIDKANTGNVPLLLAHGNHDSYLMGTINTPLSGSDSHLQDWQPLLMEDSTIPTRESFWSKKAKIKARHEANWLNACFSPLDDDDQNIMPMNKSLWLATYIDHLEKFGLIEHKESKNKNTSQRSYNLSYSVKENSALANIHYEAKGRWYPPIIENKAKNSKTSWVYKSFIVQKVKFDTTNVIIIDSSVCKLAGLWYKFIKANAGTKACIGKEQKKIIYDYICKLDKHERLIIASHFPLNDLDSKDKSDLLSLMSSFNDAIYFSAHTHAKETMQYQWGNITEINMGSTTDWPMESNSVWFNTDNKPLSVKTTSLKTSDKVFTLTINRKALKAELCRHLPVAKALATLPKNIKAEQWTVHYTESECDPKYINDFQKLGVELQTYINKINNKVKGKSEEDIEYRKTLIAIASNAALDESNDFSLIDYFSSF